MAMRVLNRFRQMDRRKRVRLAIFLFRLFCALSVPLLLFGGALFQLRVPFLRWTVCAIFWMCFVSVLMGTLLSVCPRCGKSNKDALYSFGRMLPIMEIVIFGKLPLCYACERELAAKASAKKDGKPESDHSPPSVAVGDRRVVCDVDALTRADCFRIEIPRKLKVALILMAIAIPNIALLSLAVLHVTGVKPLW